MKTLPTFMLLFNFFMILRSLLPLLPSCPPNLGKSWCFLHSHFFSQVPRLGSVLLKGKETNVLFQVQGWRTLRVHQYPHAGYPEGLRRVWGWVGFPLGNSGDIEEPSASGGKGWCALGRESEPRMCSRSVALFSFVFQYGFAMFFNLLTYF